MKFKAKKFLLFDLDGTVTDSGAGIINSLKYTLKAYNIHDYDEKSLTRFIGPPLFESLAFLLGLKDQEQIKKAVEVYREYYRDRGIYENSLYQGIDILLQKLSEDGRILLLATSKAQVYAEKILEHFSIAKYFSHVLGSGLDGTMINKNDIVRHAIKVSGIRPEDAVMIGDREHDVIGAAANGIASIGVLYGYGSREELENAGADAIVPSVVCLEELLTGMEIRNA